MSVANAWGDPPQIVRNHTLDSTRWHEFACRPGDIMISTWAKSGTTWIQAIIAELLFEGRFEGSLNGVSPWLENRCFPLEQTCQLLESQGHRRFLKTHLPATALPFRSDMKYLFVGRDGRDVVWSWHNHHRNLLPSVYELMARTPGCHGPQLSPPTEDIRQFFIDWMNKDGYPLWPFWPHLRSWWSLAGRPNVLLLHFQDLKEDLRASVTRIATFLEIELPAEMRDRVVGRCSFDRMKERASDLFPEYARSMAGGAATFIHRGMPGTWRNVLTRQDNIQYERQLLTEVGPECARWLSRPHAFTE